MTEAEWLACTDPRKKLVFLEGKASARKARLYTCGLGHSLLPYLGDERSRRVVEVAELYADNQATKAELAAAEEAACDAMRGTASRAVAWVGDHGDWQAARMIVVAIHHHARTEHDAKDWRDQLAKSSRNYLHCVFGNPFHPVRIYPTWLTWNDGTIHRLSQAIYSERAFDRLPILADALEEAGCTDADILNHCRQPGEHVRGCWVVDLLLGKK